MTALKPCPCGKVPERLDIERGSTHRYRFVCGDCCGGWWIEAYVGYHLGPDDETTYAACVEAWNEAGRGGDALVYERMAYAVEQEAEARVEIDDLRAERDRYRAIIDAVADQFGEAPDGSGSLVQDEAQLLPLVQQLLSDNERLKAGRKE